MEEIEQLAQLIIESKKVVVFTGAGISTESGIPDFRSPGGLWSRYNPEEFTIQKFLSSPAARRTHWQMLTESGLIADAEPNLAHYAIADLHQMDKLDCVITQNVDNLHQKAGVPGEKVFELHGNMKRVICMNCHKRFPLPEILKGMAEEKIEVPDCPACNGILKPDAVFFGEALPQDTLMEATRRSQNCDLFIVVGSTLVIHPAALMPSYAQQSGASLSIVNLSSTPMDCYAKVLICGKAGETMSEVVKKVKLAY